MDFFQALKQNGLSHAIPTHKKSYRPYAPASPYSRRAVTPNTPHRTYGRNTAQFDWQRYQQTVPPEFAYGTSFKEAMQHSTPREMKQLSNYANDAFADAISSLDRWYYKGK